MLDFLRSCFRPQECCKRPAREGESSAGREHLEVTQGDRTSTTPTRGETVPVESGGCSHIARPEPRSCGTCSIGAGKENQLQQRAQLGEKALGASSLAASIAGGVSCCDNAGAGDICVAADVLAPAPLRSSGDGNSSKGFAVIGHGYRKAHGAATAAVEPPEAPEDTQQGASGCTAMAVSAVAIASAAAATAAHSRRQDPAASAAAAAGADRILATVQDPDTAEMAGPLVLLGEAHVPVNPVRQQQQQRGEGGGYGGALLPGSGRLLEAPEQQHTPHLQLDGLGRATAPTRAWGYCPAGGAAAPAGGPPVPRATAPAAQVLRHRRLFGYTGRDALYDVLNQLGGSSSGDDEAAQMLHSEGLPATPRADTAARLPAPSTAPPAWHVVQLVPQQALLQAWAAQHHQQCLQHPGASPSATGECASVWSGCRTSTTTTTNTMRLSVTLGGVCVGLVSGTEIQDVHQDTDGGVAAQTTNTTQPGAAVTAAY